MFIVPTDKRYSINQSIVRDSIMVIHKYLVETVNLALGAGLRVFIAQKGNYGFITDSQGSTVLSIQVDGLRFSTSGNYRPTKARDGMTVGQGWRIGDDWLTTKDDVVTAFNTAKHPPHWETKGLPVTLTTLETQLSSYNKYCNYTEITEAVSANS